MEDGRASGGNHNLGEGAATLPGHGAPPRSMDTVMVGRPSGWDLLDASAPRLQLPPPLKSS